jgi:drug/metabolite transporter (DMT)-like permease
MNPLIKIFIATLLIGAAPIFGRLGSRIINPALFSFYDALTAFTALSILIMITKPKMKKGVFKHLLAGGLIFSIAIILYYTSLSIMSSVNVSFLGQFQLLFTIIISFLILKEKFTHKKIFGTLIVLIGGLLIIYQENINLSAGWLYAVLAYFLYSFVNLANKILRNKNLDSKIIFFFFFGIISITLIPYLIILDIPIVINDGLIFAVINGLVCDVAGWILFTSALKDVDLSKAFMMYSFTSLFTLIYSVLIFGIDFTLIQLLGGALLIFGNVIANKKSKKLV